MDSSYIKSAKLAQQLPAFSEPEVAFIGRSNVGKSSLLNALLMRKGLAREGRTPGVTQMVNFFRVSSGKKALIFADLPGYGFAKTAKGDRGAWVELVDTYLKRDNIVCFLFLTDARREWGEDDAMIVRHLAALGKPIRVVLTKADKLSANEIKACGEAHAKTALAVAGNKADVEVFMVSSLKGKGIEDLRDETFKLAGLKTR